MVDGGDQVAATLALLLVPVALTDPRRSHWQGTGTGGSGRLDRRPDQLVPHSRAGGGDLPVRRGAQVPGRGVGEWNGALLLLEEPQLWGSRAPTSLDRLDRADRAGRAADVERAPAGALPGRCADRAAPLPQPAAARGDRLPRWHRRVPRLPTFALTMSAALVLYLRPLWRPFVLPELLRRPVARSSEPVARVTVAP